MGRTGKLWGVDHWDVVPDIMCLGKSIGGGVMPLSAFISTPEIWEVLIPNPIIHSTTFGGNPIACAAGIAAIQVTLEEDLPGQAATKGDYPPARARRAAAKYPQVLSDVHGKGLLIGMEFPTHEIGWQVRRGPLQAGRAGGGHLLQGAGHPDRAGAGHPDGLLGELLTPIGGYVQGSGRKVTKRGMSPLARRRGPCSGMSPSLRSG